MPSLKEIKGVYWEKNRDRRARPNGWVFKGTGEWEGTCQREGSNGESKFQGSPIIGRSMEGKDKCCGGGETARTGFVS